MYLIRYGMLFICVDSDFECVSPLLLIKAIFEIIHVIYSLQTITLTKKLVCVKIRLLIILFSK